MGNPEQRFRTKLDFDYEGITVAHMIPEGQGARTQRITVHLDESMIELGRTSVEDLWVAEHPVVRPIAELCLTAMGMRGAYASALQEDRLAVWGMHSSGTPDSYRVLPNGTNLEIDGLTVVDGRKWPRRKRTRNNRSPELLDLHAIALAAKQARRINNR